jgi:anti-anti-sigma factor
MDMVDESLTTRVVRHLDYRALVVAGEIDVHTVPWLREQLVALIEEDGRPLVIDLAGVSFCDSSGVNLAAMARNHAARRGVDFAIAGLSARVDRVFRMTGMDRLIRTYATLPEAAFDLIRTNLPD